jgi:hypothetical protein
MPILPKCRLGDTLAIRKGWLRDVLLFMGKLVETQPHGRLAKETHLLVLADVSLLI